MVLKTDQFVPCVRLIFPLNIGKNKAEFNTRCRMAFLKWQQLIIGLYNMHTDALRRASLEIIQSKP